MTMKRARSSGAWTAGLARTGVAVLVLSAAAGCGEETAEDLTEASGSIRFGDTVTTASVGVVAMYHRNYDDVNSDWYYHPCTGTVLNTSGLGNMYILTARHCVTPLDAPNEVDGPALSPSNLRFSGDFSAGTSPPSNAVQACEVFVPPSPNNGYLDMNETLDMAIVHVCKLIPGLATAVIHSTPLYMGSSGDLQDQIIEMYGFGCNTTGDQCAGGGVLRHSTDHQITGFETGDAGVTGYDYNTYYASNGDNGAYLVHGDSGGPSFWTGPNSKAVQVGVHRYGGASNSSEDVAVSRITTQWIQQAIGHLYVRPHNAMSEALTRSGLQSGASVSSVATISVNSAGSSAVQNQQWLQYEFSSRHIHVPSSLGNTCLRRNSDNSLQMQTCSTSTSQKWWVTIDNTIRTSDQYCLQRSSSGGVSVAPCSSTSKAQKWYFDVDSHVAPVF